MCAFLSPAEMLRAGVVNGLRRVTSIKVKSSKQIIIIMHLSPREKPEFKLLSQFYAQSTITVITGR